MYVTTSTQIMHYYVHTLQDICITTNSINDDGMMVEIIGELASMVDTSTVIGT